MAQTETVICYMRCGYKQSFGRLRGAPTIPAKPANVELDPHAAKYLRAMGTAFVEITPEQLATWDADQKVIAEKRATARAKREAGQKDTMPRRRRAKRDTRPGTPKAAERAAQSEEPRPAPTAKKGRK